jgi:hypothetical protein
VVTKRTGRPPGRPRKPRPPRRSKPGRPPQDFRHDPDRYAIALLDAMLVLEMGSRFDCARAVAVWLVGWEAAEQRASVEHPGFVVTNWRAKPTRPGAAAATVKGKALTLLQKQSRPADFRREMLAQAFDLVLRARNREATAKLAPIVFQMAAMVGEGEFGARVMVPMMIAKFATTSNAEAGSRPGFR